MIGTFSYVVPLFLVSLFTPSSSVWSIEQLQTVNKLNFKWTGGDVFASLSRKQFISFVSLMNDALSGFLVPWCEIVQEIKTKNNTEAIPGSPEELEKMYTPTYSTKYNERALSPRFMKVLFLKAEHDGDDTSNATQVLFISSMGTTGESFRAVDIIWIKAAYGNEKGLLVTQDGLGDFTYNPLVIRTVGELGKPGIPLKIIHACVHDVGKNASIFLIYTPVV